MIFNIVLITQNRTKIILKYIYDGVMYQKHIKRVLFWVIKNNISLLWNADGASVFKSSNYSIWPLYFVINKLPVHKRWCKHNVILGGLWFGRTFK